MLNNPFTLMVYDKSFAFKGYVGNPTTLVVTPRFNQTGTATLVVDMDHRMAGDLTADGARMVIYKDGNFLMSGKLHQKQGEGPTIDSTLTVYLKSDFRLLHNVLGWPVPGASLTAQTNEYHTVTGNAETIVKTVVTANMITRLGMDVTCAANLGRGATVPSGATFRFHPLYERLFPAIETAGIGITFEQSGAGIVCDVFVPPVYPHTLTEESGVLQWWSWTTADPTATRVVAGGDGDGVERTFIGITDSALETSHNDVIEVFKDARDAEDSTVLTARAEETLTENAPKSGFAVRLSESETHQYGRGGLVVGAQVTISVGGVTRTDILREVTMSFTRNDGVEVTPVIGEIQDNPDRAIANFLFRLKKSISDLKVSK